MHLRLGGACTDRSPRAHVGCELWCDGVEELTRSGHTQPYDIEEQLSTYAQALVDFIRVVEEGVVDEAFPAHRCAWFLEVGARDYAEVCGSTVGVLSE